MEATFELRVTLTESQGELLDRAREVLANMRGGGRMPSLPEILIKALEALLDKRDPLRKAERRKARAESSPSSEKQASAEVETEAEAEAEAVSGLASPGNGDHSEDNLTLRCRRPKKVLTKGAEKLPIKNSSVWSSPQMGRYC